MHISTRQITSKKVRGNIVDFSISEITSKKVRGNSVDFWTNEITSKKVRGNDVDFLTIKITSKKYEEMTWKFVEIWSSTYRRNIPVESTWIRLGVPVEFSLWYVTIACTFSGRVFLIYFFICNINSLPCFREYGKISWILLEALLVSPLLSLLLLCNYTSDRHWIVINFMEYFVRYFISSFTKLSSE